MCFIPTSTALKTDIKQNLKSLINICQKNCPSNVIASSVVTEQQAVVAGVVIGNFQNSDLFELPQVKSWYISTKVSLLCVELKRTIVYSIYYCATPLIVRIQQQGILLLFVLGTRPKVNVRCTLK